MVAIPKMKTFLFSNAIYFCRCWYYSNLFLHKFFIVDSYHFSNCLVHYFALYNHLIVWILFQYFIYKICTANRCAFWAFRPCHMWWHESESSHSQHKSLISYRTCGKTIQLEPCLFFEKCLCFRLRICVCVFTFLRLSFFFWQVSFERIYKQFQLYFQAVFEERLTIYFSFFFFALKETYIVYILKKLTFLKNLIFEKGALFFTSQLSCSHPLASLEKKRNTFFNN